MIPFERRSQYFDGRIKFSHDAYDQRLGRKVGSISTEILPKLAFHNFPADRFVFNFAGLVNGNVRGAVVSDPALFGIDVGGRQF